MRSVFRSVPLDPNAPEFGIGFAIRAGKFNGDVFKVNLSDRDFHLMIAVIYLVI